MGCMFILQSGTGASSIYVAAVSQTKESYTLTGEKKLARRFRSERKADEAAGLIYKIYPMARGSLTVMPYKQPPPKKKYMMIIKTIEGDEQKLYDNNFFNFFKIVNFIKKGHWRSLYLKNLEVK